MRDVGGEPRLGRVAAGIGIGIAVCLLVVIGAVFALVGMQVELASDTAVVLVALLLVFAVVLVVLVVVLALVGVAMLARRRRAVRAARSDVPRNAHRS